MRGERRPSSEVKKALYPSGPSPTDALKASDLAELANLSAWTILKRLRSREQNCLVGSWNLPVEQQQV